MLWLLILSFLSVHAMDNTHEQILEALIKDHKGTDKSIDWFRTKSDDEKKIELGLLLNAVITDFKVFPDKTSSLCKQLQVLISNYGADPLCELPVYEHYSLACNGACEVKRKTTSPIQEAIENSAVDALRLIAELRPDIFQNKSNIELFLKYAPYDKCPTIGNWLLDKWTVLLKPNNKTKASQ